MADWAVGNPSFRSVRGCVEPSSSSAGAHKSSVFCTDIRGAGGRKLTKGPGLERCCSWSCRALWQLCAFTLRRRLRSCCRRRSITSNVLPKPDPGCLYPASAQVQNPNSYKLALSKIDRVPTLGSSSGGILIEAFTVGYWRHRCCDHTGAEG